MTVHVSPVSDDRVGNDPTSRSWPPSIDAVWAVLAVALPALLTLLRQTQALDLAYHLRAGSWMIDARRLLDMETFTYTVPGAEWLNQQWGSQLVLAATYRAGGWVALDLLRTATVALIALLVYRSCRAVRASPRTSAILTIAGSLVGLEILSALRPQQFGCLAFALVVWCVTTRHRHPGRLWLIPVVVALWANAHGTFPLGLALLVFAAVEDRLAAAPTARRTVVVLAVATVATVVTPFGPGVWTYIAELARHPVVASRVAEWQPLDVLSGNGIVFSMSLAAAIVIVVVHVRRSGRIPWLSLVELMFFGGLALAAVRGVVWWAIAAPVLLGGLMADDDAEHAPTRSMVNAVAIGIVLLLVPVAASGHRGMNASTGAPAMLTLAPEELVDALRREVPAGAAVFASQIDASWAEFSAPMYRYAVDSRIELFPREVWDRYDAISQGRDGWDALLAADDVQAVLVDAEQASGLMAVIDGHPGWRLVARSDGGALYVRT